MFRRLISLTGSVKPTATFRFNNTITPSFVARPSAISALRMYSGAPAPLTVQEIEDRIMELLRNFDKVKKDNLTLDSHFVNDLGLDSLDQVEITMELEDEFGIEIADKDAEQIYSIRQAVETIYANKNAM